MPAHASSAPSDDASVHVRGVSKRFGATTVLDDVSLEVKRGEFVSLLGPSGCGKTTLLRIIAGFETASAGTVLIDGKDVTGVPAHARSTNMVFQNLALFPHMTVAENVAFGLRMKRTPADQIGPKVRQALELVQLGDYGTRLPEQLSGGQRQRVAMARALVNDPAVLLLDEPLGALDLQLRLQLQVELRRLHRSLGSTFIFVTHDQVEAMTMSDRIAVLAAGRIVQVGTPQDIYESPRARFVANFIGHANLLDGTVVGHEAGRTTVVQLVEGHGIVHAAPTPAVPIGAIVTVVLRYEKLMLGDGVERVPGTFLHGAVIDNAYMGSIIRLTIRADSGHEVTADVPVSESARSIAAGTRIDLRWSPSDAAVLTQ